MGALESLAFDEIKRPSFADVTVVALPEGAPTDPALWAREIFSVENAPRWVKALFALRQALVGLVGIAKGDRSVFDIDRIADGEALIIAREGHLDFAAGIAVDSERHLLRVVTAVQHKGWRGRLYFAPVSLLHGPVTRAMATRAVRRVCS